jgi:hypothetical protein
MFGQFVWWCPYVINYWSDGFAFLCILIKALSCCSMGFICSRYLCWFFISMYCICILFVEFVYEIYLWGLCLVVLFGFLVGNCLFFVLVFLCVLWPWFYFCQLLLPLNRSVIIWSLFILGCIDVLYVLYYVCLCIRSVWLSLLLDIWMRSALLCLGVELHFLYLLLMWSSMHKFWNRT